MDFPSNFSRHQNRYHRVCSSKEAITHPTVQDHSYVVHSAGHFPERRLHERSSNTRQHGRNMSNSSRVRFYPMITPCTHQTESTNHLKKMTLITKVETGKQEQMETTKQRFNQTQITRWVPHASTPLQSHRRANFAEHNLAPSYYT